MRRNIMNEEEYLQLKRLIRSRISLLEEVLSSSGDVSERKKRQDDDDAANLDMTINAAVESQVVDHTEQELRRLKQNLQWLDSEDAGHCDECGRNIPYARLQAVPETRLCVLCAGKKGE